LYIPFFLYILRQEYLKVLCFAIKKIRRIVMKFELIFRNFFIFALLILVFRFCFSQESSIKSFTCCVSGTATTQGGPAVNCNVTITKNDQVICSTTTRSDGKYECCGDFSNLDQYTLTIYCNSSCHTFGSYNLTCSSVLPTIDVPCE